MTKKFIYSEISIHAAREGGDAFYHIVRVVSHHFNPRRP